MWFECMPWHPRQELLGCRVPLSKCYNAYNSYTRRIDEAIAHDGAQYAPASGERKTLEAHRESARLDGERCQRAAGGRRLKAVGICLPGFSRFTGWQASLCPRQHPGDMGGHVASSKLQGKCQGRGQASEVA